MLTRVEVETKNGSLLSLLLDDSYSGLLIENIDGLGPVKATISSSALAQIDGEQYQASRRGTRNLVFKIVLEPDWATETVGDLRDRAYEFFMPKTMIDLRFYSDNRNPVRIQGMVESAEPDIFSQEPAITISIICFQPDFVDETPIEILGNTTLWLTKTDIAYTGTVSSGILFKLMVNRALSDFSIYLNDQQLDFTGALIAGDVLTISTEPGQKYARLMRAGNESSYLYGVTSQSEWVQLRQGTNEFRVYANGAAIPYSLTYTNRYGGL